MKTRRCVLRVSFVCQERISTWQDQKARMRFRIGLPLGGVLGILGRMRAKRHFFAPHAP